MEEYHQNGGVSPKRICNSRAKMCDEPWMPAPIGKHMMMMIIIITIILLISPTTFVLITIILNKSGLYYYRF